jgi:hypothetical protein
MKPLWLLSWKPDSVGDTLATSMSETQLWTEPTEASSGGSSGSQRSDRSGARERVGMAPHALEEMSAVALVCVPSEVDASPRARHPASVDEGAVGDALEAVAIAARMGSIAHPPAYAAVVAPFSRAGPVRTHVGGSLSLGMAWRAQEAWMESGEGAEEDDVPPFVAPAVVRALDASLRLLDTSAGDGDISETVWGAEPSSPALPQLRTTRLLGPRGELAEGCAPARGSG